MKTLGLALRYVRRHWWSYLLGVLSLIAVDILDTCLPMVTGLVTDGLADRSLDQGGVYRLVGELLLMGLGIMAGRFGWRLFLFGSARTVEREMRDDLFAHLETLSQRYFNRNKTGDLMSRFTNDLAWVRQLVGMTVITTTDASFMLVLVLWRMATYVSVKLTLVAVTPMVLICIGDVIYGKAMHRRFREKQDAFSDLSDQVQESVSGIRVIKAFVQERKELEAFAKADARCRDKNMKVARLRALFIPLLDMVIGTSVLLTLLYGGLLAIRGEITLGRFVAFNSYLTTLVWPMMAVGEAITSISQGMAALARVREVFDAKPEIVDGPACDRSITELRGGISLNRLTFRYPDADGQEVLRDITLEIPAGSSLAIVGRTGAGKSTLVSLLSRLYDTEPGMISFDGHPVETIPLEVLRGSIACVPQESFLFSDTVAGNIAFGVAGVTREQIEQAAKDACVHDNIMEFPDGYDTLVGERGATVSGGQKQRMAIARALLRDAPVLVLDDSLSAVDTDTEERILQGLKRARAGRTTIIIAHRVSTIRACDRILVLEDGRVAEYGPHDELMARGGLYRDLVERQQLEHSLREEGGDAE